MIEYLQLARAGSGECVLVHMQEIDALDCHNDGRITVHLAHGRAETITRESAEDLGMPCVQRRLGRPPKCQLPSLTRAAGHKECTRSLSCGTV